MGTVWDCCHRGHCRLGTHGKGISKLKAKTGKRGIYIMGIAETDKRSGTMGESESLRKKHTILQAVKDRDDISHKAAKNALSASFFDSAITKNPL